MGQHGSYGAEVLRRATDNQVILDGPSVEIDYGTGSPARIDATLGSEIAIEVEARVSKQIRGAILDLICHPFPLKLLLIIPAHAHKPLDTEGQANFIFSKFLDRSSFQVCLLDGTGDRHNLNTDAKKTRLAISRFQRRAPMHAERRIS